MKRIICLIGILLLLLCGCSQNGQASDPVVGTFSYETDLVCYQDEPGIKRSGFVNTTQSDLQNAQQAVELAKNECTVDYDTIDVDFDSDSKIYRFSLYKAELLGGNQDVYINQNGITQLIIYGEQATAP